MEKTNTPEKDSTEGKTTKQKGREASRNFKKKFQQLRSRAREAGMDIELQHEKTFSTSFQEVRVANYNTLETANRKKGPGQFVLTLNQEGIRFELNRIDAGGSGKKCKNYQRDDFMYQEDFANYVFLEMIEEEIEKQEKDANKEYTKDKRAWENTLENITHRGDQK